MKGFLLNSSIDGSNTSLDLPSLTPSGACHRPLEAVEDVVLTVFQRLLGICSMFRTVTGLGGGGGLLTKVFLQPSSFSSLGLVSSAPAPQLGEKHSQMCQEKSSLRSSLVMDFVRSS